MIVKQLSMQSVPGPVNARVVPTITHASRHTFDAEQHPDFVSATTTQMPCQMLPAESLYSSRSGVTLD